MLQFSNRSNFVHRLPKMYQGNVTFICKLTNKLLYKKIFLLRITFYICLIKLKK